MADQSDIGQIEFGQQGIEVGGERVVVVAVSGLAGFPESAPVVGDDPGARPQQGRNLLVPGAAAERVAVNQDDRSAVAVVLVIQIDVFGILLSDGYMRHGSLPCRLAVA